MGKVYILVISKYINMTKNTKKLIATGVGLSVGSIALGKVSGMLPAQASGVSKGVFSGMNIASAAMPIYAGKTVMDATKMLYKKK